MNANPYLNRGCVIIEIEANENNGHVIRTSRAYKENWKEGWVEVPPYLLDILWECKGYGDLTITDGVLTEIKPTTIPTLSNGFQPTEVSCLRGDVSTLQSENATLKSQKEALQDEVNQLKTQMSDLETTIVDTQMALCDMYEATAGMTEEEIPAGTPSVDEEV